MFTVAAKTKRREMKLETERKRVGRRQTKMARERDGKGERNKLRFKP